MSENNPTVLTVKCLGTKVGCNNKALNFCELFLVVVIELAKKCSNFLTK